MNANTLILSAIIGGEVDERALEYAITSLLSRLKENAENDAAYVGFVGAPTVAMVSHQGVLIVTLTATLERKEP